MPNIWSVSRSDERDISKIGASISPSSSPSCTGGLYVKVVNRALSRKARPKLA